MPTFCILRIQMLPLNTFTHRKFVVLNQNTSILQAARAMCDNQIGCLLVGDGNGNATGILTDRDFACRWALSLGGKDVPIEQIMSRDLVTANEASSLSVVIQLMERHGIRRIPIVRKARGGQNVFVGIVTLDDLQASHQIEPNQLARIIRRQIGRRMTLMAAHTPTTAHAQLRSNGHRRQSIESFYTFLSEATGLDSDILPKVTRFIIGALVMRVTYTTASHLLAQLPQLIREPLLKLPPGPDRSYSAERILQELSTRFHFDEEQARAVLHRVLFSLKGPMGLQAMDHVQAQLPDEFQPYFEPITLDALPSRMEPETIGRPATAARHGTVAAASNPRPKPWAVHHSFSNRTQAAEDLIRALEQYRGQNPLVLGIPRGSVPMTKIIADRLGGDLDVVLVHKIGAPGNPEFAIGSVSEFGTTYRSQAIDFYEVPPKYIETSAQAEITKLQARRKAYSPIRPPIDPKDRIVIIVDDGIATGSTMLAAVRAIRSQGAKRIVVAAPVASPSALESLAGEADEFVILETPEDFFSISQFYDDFPQVTDDEVLHALSKAKRARSKEAA